METELKFQVPPASAAKLERAVATASAQTTRLQAVYAETADRRLAANQMALRLRKEGRLWVQTLKGRGDGMLNRLEHEVPLPMQRGTPVLDVQRHAGTAVGDKLIALLDGAPLRSLYTTDITRLHRVARFHEARIEIAFDRGWLMAGEGLAKRKLAVHEIEFELKAGPPQLLAAFAMRWVAQHGLWWDCRTKSERGMRLALGVETVPAVPAGARLPIRSFKAWQAALANALSHALPNAAELASGLGSVAHTHELQASLGRLRHVLGLGSAGALAGPADVLRQTLDMLLARPAWSPTELNFNAVMLGALSLSLPLTPDA
jgi:triphosphatase